MTSAENSNLALHPPLEGHQSTIYAREQHVQSADRDSYSRALLQTRCLNLKP